MSSSLVLTPRLLNLWTAMCGTFKGCFFEVFWCCKTQLSNCTVLFAERVFMYGCLLRICTDLPFFHRC